MNRNAQTSRFLSMQVKLPHGIITAIRFGNVTLQICHDCVIMRFPQIIFFDFSCSGSYFFVVFICSWLHVKDNKGSWPWALSPQPDVPPHAAESPFLQVFWHARNRSRRKIRMSKLNVFAAEKLRHQTLLKKADDLPHQTQYATCCCF